MVSDALAPWAEPVLHTAHDLESLPENGWRYELVQGRLVRMPPTGFEHSEIAGRLYTSLRAFVVERELGTVTMPETGFLVSGPGEPETVLAPDLAFISGTRAPAPSFSGFPRLAPDLAVEIASPSQHHPELAAKARLWLSAGTRLVWVIWPRERTVEVWKQGSTEPFAAPSNVDGGDVLPGFLYPQRDLFSS